MVFSVRTLSILVVVAIGLAALAVLLASAAARRRAGKEPGAPLALDPAVRGLLQGQQEQVRRLEQAIRALNATDKRQAETMRAAIGHVALLRYDAFEDVGGRLSFSCALLDDRGNGVVLTSINGRQETRVYAKPIQEGRSAYNLSLEEEEVLRQAMAAPGEAVQAR
jgi:hypothetical protein